MNNKYICFVLLALYTVLNYTSYKILALYTLVPAAFVLSLFSARPRFNIYMKYLAFWYFWTYVSSFFAAYPSLASTQMHQILGCILFLYPLYVLSKDRKMTVWLYALWILYFAVSLQYALTHVITTSFDYTSQRADGDDEGMNANHLSQYLIYFSMCIYIYGRFLKNIKWRIWLERLFFLTLPLAFFVAIITASRQLLLQEIPLVALLIYVRYFKGTKIVNKTRYIVFIATVVVISTPKIYSIYDNSYLAQRNSESYEEDTRVELLKSSFQVGFEHPIVGVGPANFIKFSFNGSNAAHNTFGETFANSGLPALFCSIAIVFIFLKRQYKRYKQFQDKVFLEFFILGGFYVFGNFFMSFHTSLWLLGFFVLLSTHSENYYEEKYLEHGCVVN